MLTVHIEVTNYLVYMVDFKSLVTFGHQFKKKKFEAYLSFSTSLKYLELS